MARTTTPLTDTKIKTAKAKEKDYKLSDGGGLFLLITTRGSKLWRLKYRFDGKEKLLSLGKYPEITLTKARELRDQNKKLLADGVNPSDVKQAKKEAIKVKAVQSLNTFKKVAFEKIERLQENGISDSHYKRILRGFNNDVFPVIGDKPIDTIVEGDILDIIEKMDERGVKNSIQKVYSSINTTFKYAIAKRYIKTNPANGIELSEVIGKPKVQNYPTITDDIGIKNLLISIKEYGGEPSTKYALLFLSLTFVRPSNARLALWEEIDLKSKQWVIPANKMKTKEEFLIPLSTQAVELLKEVKKYAGDSPYLFPSTKSKTTPFSDGALLGAIRRMGYSKTEFVPHGFRSMFSTIAHEKSPFKHDVIETQLAHSVGNSVSQAYNRAKYFDERVELMQWWGDYLEEVQK